VAWTVAPKDYVVTYGEGIPQPTQRRYPLRLMAAAAALWFNRRHPDAPRYTTMKL